MTTRLSKNGNSGLVSAPLVLESLTAREQELIDDILRDLKSSFDRFAAAGRKWVGLDEKLKGKIVAATPPAQRDIWDRLERVGLGTLHPQLVPVRGLAARYLGRLPIADQGRYLAERIPVAITIDGKPDVLAIDVSAMTARQRMQVFHVGTGGALRVREIAEQRAWLADRERVEREKERAATERARLRGREIHRAGKWDVRSGKVFFDPEYAKAGLSRKDVKQLLKDLGD